ncbi:MAG TPA: class I SAM-dependent methyltransferase [Candidatus Dormibacteraeota bacterium]|nr:class I SAM-dependent methyltransferase [Candidatus Dormibacteraeota bacterium]
MDATSSQQKKGYKGLPMEGIVARRYAELRRSGSQIDEWREQAAQLTATLPDGANVLEVAPGPGYFAIELARLGRFRVTGLDISRTFVDIASENARQAGVSVDFRRGDAASMLLADESFDLIVCQAAFKNFAQPARALEEMYRVLRAGGMAVIQDMSRDASNADIGREVSRMRLGRVSAFTTNWTLRVLRRRAYTSERFRELAAASPFGTCEIQAGGIGLDVRLKKL